MKKKDLKWMKEWMKNIENDGQLWISSGYVIQFWPGRKAFRQIYMAPIHSSKYVVKLLKKLGWTQEVADGFVEDPETGAMFHLYDDNTDPLLNNMSYVRYSIGAAISKLGVDPCSYDETKPRFVMKGENK